MIDPFELPMETGKRLRLRRIFRREKAIIVPMDHAIYFGPIEALQDPRELVRRMAAGGADGILIPPGTLPRVVDVVGPMAVLLRLDGTVSRLGAHIEVTSRVRAVEQAAALGADAVVLNVYVGTDNEDSLLKKLGETADACRQCGLLLVGEMIPAPLLNAHYGKGPDGLSPERRAEYIGVAARIGAEIGADILKINYSGTPDSFRPVTRNAHRPALVAGGVKSGTPLEFLRGVRDALDAGAAGICAGRNLWDRTNVDGLLRALYKVVHGEASVEEAVAELG